MSRIVFSSTEKSAGKTTVIIGIWASAEKKFGYMKPLGDRLVYQRKRLWDYDAHLLCKIFNIPDEPDTMSIGFEHVKLRYMYNAETTARRVQEIALKIERERGDVFVETGKDLAFGSSVHMDAVSVAKYINGKMVVVVRGDTDTVLDSLVFIKKYLRLEGVKLAGVVVNGVKNTGEFVDTSQKVLEETGIPVLGVLPHVESLSETSVRYLADRLFAKVLCGENALDKPVKRYLIGAMSASSVYQHPLIKEKYNMLITSGDRTDMIIAGIENNASCILLTNNILPPSNIISQASVADIPLLLVPWDTYTVAVKIDNMEPLLTINEKSKIDLIKEICSKHLKISEILS
ncbi:MAG: DRTGG domain-containing protein [Thermoplasmata archaeon]|nr:DRTGG domain-containing protein [Thermoplasmata archaeon]